MSKNERAGEAGDCEIMANLWRIIQGVLDDSEADFGALELSPKAFFLLEALGDHPFPAELARRMRLPPPTVTYLIKQLEGLGFVERRAEPADLRRFRLAPTEAGRGALAKGREALSRALSGRLRRLEPGDVATFGRIVGRLASEGDRG